MRATALGSSCFGLKEVPASVSKGANSLQVTELHWIIVGHEADRGATNT